jgi:exosortase H (IPTLxxWG-CTERM-specific)
MQKQEISPLRPGHFVAFFALAALVQFALLLTPWFRPVIDGFSRSLVWASGVLIHALGGKASVQGVFLGSPVNGFTIEMRDGCNGVNVMILMWSAVLAFPVTRSWKVVGILAGAVAIQGLNFFRFISLFYLGQYSLSLFEFAHLYLWETLIMLDALIVFGLWVKRAPPRLPAAYARK